MAELHAVPLRPAARILPGGRGIKPAALTILASLLFFGGLVEIGMRLIQPVGSERQPKFAMDEQTGWAWAPNQGGFVYQRNYAAPDIFKTTFRTNTLGMRDREYSIVKGNIVRILAIGDSFTEGWGVEEDQAYPKVLEHRFLRGAEVWNLGVVGYSTDQELQQLCQRIAIAKPDLVILGFYENDIADNTRSRSLWYPRFDKCRFALQNDRLILTNGQRLIRQKESAERQARSGYGIPDLLLSSAAIRFASFTLRKIQYQHTVSIRSNPEEEVWAKTNSYRLAETPEMREAWALTERLLVEMGRLCDRYGAKFVVVYIPRALEVVPGILEKENGKFSLGEPLAAFDSSLPERKLAEVTMRNGIRFVKTRDRFREIRNPERLYLPQILKDGHLSMQGHLLLAELLADYFREQALLPATHLVRQNDGHPLR